MAQILAPYDIQSVHSKHPQLPQDLVYTLKLDTNLLHNAPVTPKLVREAEATAIALERIQEFHVPITEAVIQTAKNRATSISHLYSSAEFNVPAPPAVALMDAINALQASMRAMQESQQRIEVGLQRLQGSQQRMEESQQTLRAWRDNTRIGNSNMRKSNFDGGTISYQAKLKEVPGDGAALANELAPNHVGQVPPLPEPPAIGTAFALTIEPHSLNHQAVLHLVRFYNENFGIEFGDPIAVRSQKIRTWLTSDF